MFVFRGKHEVKRQRIIFNSHRGGAVCGAVLCGDAVQPIEREQQMIDQAVSEQCNASVDYAVNKLKLIAGCDSGEINYEIDDTESSDKSCHVFDLTGGGVAPCGAYLAIHDCDLEALTIGEKCEGADLIYAGTSDGNRLYTTAADQGMFSSNNGTTNYVVTGITSRSDGKANTDALVAQEDIGAPYEAANACRGLGSEWYLPAHDELDVLYTNHVAIGGFNTSGSVFAGYYWSSSEYDNDGTLDQNFSNGAQTSTSKKPDKRSVRCVRR